jgi:hypothetical protein
LLRNTISLVFERIVDPTDLKLRLYVARQREFDWWG